MQNNYEQNCQEWQARLLAMDMEERMTALPELKLEGEYITLRHFTRKLGIHRATGEIRPLEDEEPVSVTMKLNVYTLLGYASPDACFQGEWMSFDKLRSAGPFGPAFRRGIVEPFAATFSGHMDALQDAMEQLQGKRLAHSDMGYELQAFECIPVRFLFWEGDDEFPAQGNVLFDKSATDFIHVESVVTIAMAGLVEMAKKAGVSLAPGALV